MRLGKRLRNIAIFFENFRDLVFFFQPKGKPMKKLIKIVFCFSVTTAWVAASPCDLNVAQMEWIKCVNQRLQTLGQENQALRDKVQALEKQLVTQKKELDESLTLMSIHRNDNIIIYVDAKGSKHTLNLGEGKKAIQNEWIAYKPSNNEKKEDAILYFNLTGSPSFSCTLLHDEDDAARPGFHFATDTNDDSIWGKTQASFILSRKGVTSYVIDAWAGYNILCVK